MSALNQLPLDLIEAILILLPIKSLGRLKSVSKSWYSLISGPSFIKTHILNFIKNNPNPNPTHLILHPNSDTNWCEYLYSLDIKQLNTQTLPATVTAKCLNFKKERKRIEILGSCNGLVLANDFNIYAARSQYHNLYLFNPTTHKSLKVPDSGGESKSYDATAYGFGYDSSKDDYKVIKISYKAVSDSSDLNCTLVQLYSLRNNSWNKLPNFPYKLLKRYCYNIHPGVGVLLNSNLHWLVGSNNGHSKFAIVAFSLADEELHEIELPDSLENFEVNFEVESSQLYVFGGKLFVVLYYWLFHDSICYVSCVMEEYGVSKSWKRLCKIYTDIDHKDNFFAQLSNRDILVGDCYENEIEIYNIEEKGFTKVIVEGFPEIYADVYGTYVESLESLERFR